MAVRSNIRGGNRNGDRSVERSTGGSFPRRVGPGSQEGGVKVLNNARKCSNCIKINEYD